MFSAILSFFTGVLSSLYKYVAIDAILLTIGLVGGYKIASWRFEASNAQVETKYAAQLKASQARMNDAENKAMEQLNDLAIRLTAAKVAAARHPAAGVCFDDSSVLIINGAIGGNTTTK